MTGIAGNAHTVFLPVSAEQVSTKPNETRRMTPEAWEAYAQGAEMTGDGLSREMEDGLDKAGLPRNLLSATRGFRAMGIGGSTHDDGGHGDRRP